MSDSIPYLGSKISLISKSEIRYEGILYTIDAQESIIALAKVQSFGTEDRHVEIPVPAKNEIYEYIIFRGTDIKKIEVCETPKQTLSGGLHNDPAIVGLQQHAVPPVQPVQPSYPTASFSRQQLGPIGSMGGQYYGGFGPQLGQNLSTAGSFAMGAQPSELSSGIGSSVVGSGAGSSVTGSISVEQASTGGSHPIPAPIGAPPHSGVSMQSNQQDVLTGSRSSTPSAVRKSPVSDAGVQVSPPPPASQSQDKKNNQGQRPLLSQERNKEGGQSNQRRGGQSNYSHGQSNYSQGHSNYNPGHSNYNPGHSNYNPGHSSYNQGHSSYNQGQRNNQGYQNYYPNQYQQYSGGRGAVGGMGMGMGRGRASRRTSQPRGRSVFNQGNRPRQPQQMFDKEFDFEQANEEFEELRTQFAKTKITENGEKKDDKKDDSGHETATTGDESEDSGTSSCYDKTKSFFDSISCEALERSKGRSQRPDWRQERKINVQTFGVATARRGYFSRGRGGYYNRGGGGAGGGGNYYRNYNQGYYRGNSGPGYRGSRGGGNYRGGNKSSPSNVNGAAGTMSSSSYASAVRSSSATK